MSIFLLTFYTMDHKNIYFLRYNNFLDLFISFFSLDNSLYLFQLCSSNLYCFHNIFLLVLFHLPDDNALHKNCPNTEIFWSVYLVQIRENTDQKNSVFGQFSRSDGFVPFLAVFLYFYHNKCCYY